MNKETRRFITGILIFGFASISMLILIDEITKHKEKWWYYVPFILCIWFVWKSVDLIYNSIK